MPQVVLIPSAGFSLLAVVQGSDASTVILSYTQPPDATNPATLTDALNPSNYSFTGPSLTSVSLVTRITSYMFSLTLTAPLVSGAYTVHVANVQASGAALGAPTSLTFNAVAAVPPEPANQGAVNEDDDNIIRRWLPIQYRYKTAWEALIAALTAGDKIVKDIAYSAFNQLFISTAIRPYIFQRGSDLGIQYPSSVGPSDDLFRKLVIKVTANKLVHEALLEILEVFYGQDSTRANITSGTNQPYALRNGDSVSFLFDDRDAVTVTFSSDDFSNISTASASEVAAVMTRAFRYAGVSAYASAVSTTNGTGVRVYSGALGLLGSISVTGGMAQNILQFPTREPLFASFPPPPAPAWTVDRVSQTEVRFIWKLHTLPTLINGIQPGDYVLIDLVNAGTLRGSYQVTDVHVDVNTGTGDPFQLTWFSIAPPPGFPLAVGGTVNVTQTNANEIVFYRPSRSTVIQAINPSYIAQASGIGVDVVLPATTQAVNRSAVDAAYPHVATTIAINTITRTAGLTLVDCGATQHHLVAGDMVEISGVNGPDVSPLLTVNATSGRWNIVAPILNATPTTFTVIDAGDNGIGFGGIVTPLHAPSNDVVVPGPYVFDPNSGFAVTGISTTSTDAISFGRGISQLRVASTTSFDPAGGWLVFGFGTQYEVGPVRYLGILDATTLLIDRTFVFQENIPSGFDVTILEQKGPYVPADATTVGAFYVTDSNAGRIAAQQFIEDSSAAGVNVTAKVIYPGDRGIGGQGLPTTGVKISDKVEVWAGNDVDAEVKAAHNG